MLINFLKSSTDSAFENCTVRLQREFVSNFAGYFTKLPAPRLPSINW
jgi:hypothetical protein